MAAKEKNLDSTKMREGVYKKAGNVILTAVGYGLDFVDAYYEIGMGIPMGDMVCIAITGMEAISIIENAGKINPDLSDIIGRYFSKLKGDDND